MPGRYALSGACSTNSTFSDVMMPYFGFAAVPELEAAVGAWTADRTPVEVAAQLQTAGVAAARVANSRDLIEEDPQLAARGYWQTLDHPEIGPALFTSPPYTVDGERVELKRQPLFGEHTHEILTGVLGLSEERVKDLNDRGILG